MKKKKIYLTVLFLILIAYNKFFEFKPLIDFSTKLVIIVFITLLIFNFRRLFYQKSIFALPIKYIILSFFVAVIPSVLFWDQTILQSFVSIAEYSYFLIFLFLFEAKIDRDDIVKVVLILAYISLILFCYQFIFTETNLFGAKEELTEDRGLIRVVFPGEGFMFFALFYYLNKLGNKFKMKYLLLFILFLFMMILQVTRIYILAFGLIAIYHFMIKSKVQYRIYGIIGFLACYMFFYNTDNKIVKGLREANKGDVELKEEYIRIISAEYFLYQFPKEDIVYVLGNGAYNFHSSYGKKMLKLNEDEHFYLDDLGLLKGYILFGILFVLGYVLIFIKSFRIQMPSSLLYLKYYIWMILVLSVTTRANTNAGFGAVLAVVLYLFDCGFQQQNSMLVPKKNTLLKYKI